MASEHFRQNPLGILKCITPDLATKLVSAREGQRSV
jgi:hypothetical protein